MKALNVSLGFIVLLIQLFLYLNADWVYGVYAEQAKTVLLAYFILLTVVLASFGTKLPLMGASPIELKNFFVGFVITSAVLLFIPALQSASLEQAKLALGFGLLHSFVKAFNEEAVFRGILPNVLGGSLLAGIVSSLLFGFFHVAVTGADLLAMAILSVLGFIWFLMKKRIGLMGSVGSHFAYNLKAFGVLDKLFGV